MDIILSIAGKPGLFKLVSRSKNTLIVEALDATKRRSPAFATDRVTSLADVSIYTETEEVPLWQVLKAVGEKEGGAPCSIKYKKCSGNDLHAYFASVLPEYDRDRVHDGDMKKLLQWYDILVGNGITDFQAAFAAEKGADETE